MAVQGKHINLTIIERTLISHLLLEHYAYNLKKKKVSRPEINLNFNAIFF